MVHIGNGWDTLLAAEFEAEYYQELRQFLKAEYGSRRIFPKMHDIYNAFRHTPPESVKAVILGQDPYHEIGQAHGLCFSVLPGVKQPPSLQNIFKELHADLGIETPTSHGCLLSWAKQGILLLNTSLTVREGQANSHRGHGWEILTDRVISILNGFERPIAFLLWGANARSKKQLITNPAHGIFESAHPSPLSAYNGFFGSRPFSRINAFLAQNGIAPIDWSVPLDPPTVQ